MVLIQSNGIFSTIDRITQPVTDFVRSNPITALAGIGIATTGLVAARAVVRRRKKKKAAKKKRVSRRRVSRKKKKKRVTHRSPRHKGHKRVSFITKGGKRVNFLVKKKAHTHRKLKRRSRHK